MWTPAVRTLVMRARRCCCVVPMPWATPRTPTTRWTLLSRKPSCAASTSSEVSQLRCGSACPRAGAGSAGLSSTGGFLAMVGVVKVLWGELAALQGNTIARQSLAKGCAPLGGGPSNAVWEWPCLAASPADGSQPPTAPSLQHVWMLLRRRTLPLFFPLIPVRPSMVLGGMDPLALTSAQDLASWGWAASTHTRAPRTAHAPWRLCRARPPVPPVLRPQCLTP